MNTSEHKNYWTPVIVMCLCLFILVGALAMFIRNRFNSLPPQISMPELPTTTTANSIAPKTVYPSDLLSLKEGHVWLEDSPDKTYFLLTIEKSSVSGTGEAVSYKMPLAFDRVDSPKISSGQKYGCVTGVSSGYGGYYIFSLPNGEKVDQGNQYSECVQWLSDHEVLIVENLSDTKKYSYFIVNADTKVRRLVYENTLKTPEQKNPSDAVVKPFELSH